MKREARRIAGPRRVSGEQAAAEVRSSRRGNLQPAPRGFASSTVRL